MVLEIALAVIFLLNPSTVIGIITLINSAIAMTTMAIRNKKISDNKKRLAKLNIKEIEQNIKSLEQSIYINELEYNVKKDEIASLNDEIGKQENNLDEARHCYNYMFEKYNEVLQTVDKNDKKAINDNYNKNMDEAWKKLYKNKYTKV